MARPDIYLYSSCTSCRKAEDVMRQSGVVYNRRDIFRDPLSAAEIRTILERTGQTAHDVLSTRSIPYRDLGLADRQVSEEELVELMSQYPGLLRRPIIIDDHGFQVGFRADAVQAIADRQEG